MEARGLLLGAVPPAESSFFFVFFSSFAASPAALLPFSRRLGWSFTRENLSPPTFGAGFASLFAVFGLSQSQKVKLTTEEPG